MRRASSWKPELPENGDLSKPPPANGRASVADGTGNADTYGKHGDNAAKKMPAPDGSLSWMVAIVCFLINMISSGFGRCLGLFFNSIMTTFGVSRGEASLPLSIYGGFFNLSGLVSGALIQAFGTRKSATLGGFIMIVGLSVSVFAKETLFLSFSVGFLTGSGQGILLNSIIVCVSQYFEKRRGSALGLNMAGATVASLVFPNLYEFLLAEYGLRGTLLVIGASLGNVLALAMFMNTPPWEDAKERNTLALEVTDGRRSPYDAPTAGRVSIVCGGADEDQDKLYLEIEQPPSSLSQNRKPTLISVANRGGSYRRGTIISVNDRGSVTRRGTIISVGDHAKASRRGTYVSEYPSVLSRRGTLTSSVGDGGESVVMAPDLNENRARRGTMLSVAGSLLAPNRSAICASVVDTNPARRGTVVSVGNPYNLDASSLRADSLRIELPVVEEQSESVLRNALEVLKTPRFYFHALSYLSWGFFLDSYLTVMFDFAEDIGVPASESVHALTLFSATDTVGRLFVPFLSDYGLISNCGLLAISYFTLGLLQQLAPFISGKLAFFCLSAAMGLPSGYIIVGASEILSTEIGTKNLPIAYGFMTTLTAIGGFARPPVLGFFRDNYGSYDGLFRLVGGMLTLSFLFTVGLWITGRSKLKERNTAGVVPDAFVFVPEPMPTLKEEDTDM
uniref:Putative monocarboxylate transporter n=1 Tax=Amblyomma aureolatum TaxID=187763 RepID=A0A1E1X4K2_9ACAR